MDRKKPADSTEQIKILHEVPESLKKLTLYLTKIFYGLEQYVIMYYVQNNTIIKEEQVRDLCKIDQRQFRQFVTILKVDKFLKERVITEEVDGRGKKVAYYFINYKAILNVAKYKIDHMRQKLEMKDKSKNQKASYLCTGEGCQKTYDAMDIGRIYDPVTQEMRCWQCASLVTADETSGPAQDMRSSLAKFNDQLAPIFNLLKDMDCVRFSREILDPPLASTSTAKESVAEEKPANASNKIVSTMGKTRTELYLKGEITVSIGADQEISRTNKAEVPWLRDKLPSSFSPENGISINTEAISHSLFDLPDITYNGLFIQNGQLPGRLPQKLNAKNSKLYASKNSHDHEIAALLNEVEGL